MSESQFKRQLETYNAQYNHGIISESHEMTKPFLSLKCFFPPWFISFFSPLFLHEFHRGLKLIPFTFQQSRTIVYTSRIIHLPPALQAVKYERKYVNPNNFNGRLKRLTKTNGKIMWNVSPDKKRGVFTLPELQK